MVFSEKFSPIGTLETNNGNTPPKQEYPYSVCTGMKVPISFSKKGIEGKRKPGRKPLACDLCRKAHLSCDGLRPCQRCIKKGIQEQCVDPPKRLSIKRQKTGHNPNVKLLPAPWSRTIVSGAITCPIPSICNNLDSLFALSNSSNFIQTKHGLLDVVPGENGVFSVIPQQPASNPSALIQNQPENTSENIGKFWSTYNVTDQSSVPAQSEVEPTLLNLPSDPSARGTSPQNLSQISGDDVQAENCTHRAKFAESLLEDGLSCFSYLFDQNFVDFFKDPTSTSVDIGLNELDYQDVADLFLSATTSAICKKPVESTMSMDDELKSSGLDTEPFDSDNLLSHPVKHNNVYSNSAKRPYSHISSHPSSFHSNSSLTSTSHSSSLSSKHSSSSLSFKHANRLSCPKNMGDECIKCPFNKLEIFFLKAAGDTSDLTDLLLSKREAGLLASFDYLKSIDEMHSFLEKNCSVFSLQEIITQAVSLEQEYALEQRNIQGLCTEEQLEHMLLQYDRIFSSMAIPTCIWRRGGEILKVNSGFCRLVQLDAGKITEIKMKIYDILDPSSFVHYWKKYHEMAHKFDQQSTLGTCTIYTFNHSFSSSIQIPLKHLKCTYSITIRRNDLGIPLAIIGNFLPMK